MSDSKEISSISYINKDFGSIYPEMLDLAKELTNKWDPSQSNESDPGLVLIKEGAFVADHNNYNIDKNVLENFLPSATQDRSVRNITEMNGYTPRYYVSANGDVTFVWNQPEGDSSTDLFSIPAFTFVISDANETVSYTQIEDLAISGSGVRSTCRFIEGTLQTLSINDNSIISLENLDDNNRLYLPETMVAQNGVYIRNINSDDYENFWTRNNYLLTQPLGSRVYKIDYDSLKSLPYIEFPTDIANLIGDGLKIEYIASSGSQGNVSANTLTKILSPSTFKAVGDDVERLTSNFTIYNSSSITNGKDPETINEMYQSFRKIVGTFDTLVTCKDYDNEVYTLTDNNDTPLVSNAYVTDRRTDYNKAAQVITWDIENNFKRFKTISTNKCALQFMGTCYYQADSGNPNIATMNTEGGHLNEMYYCIEQDYEGLYINTSTNSNVCNFVRQDYINLNDFAILTQAMTPYDLVLYAFKVFSMSDYNFNYFWLAYDNSFKPVSSAIREEIKADIENVKCISHTWNDPSGNDVYCFKNYAPLNILITPYNKITEVEKTEIIDHIYRALSERFNPRNIDFGVKLDVEEIESTIIASDTRIRRVDILPIEYKTKAMYSDGSEVELTSTLLLSLISKNILAGRLCLFDFNEDFKFDYGQVDGQIFNISSSSAGGTVKTELYIPLKTEDDASMVSTTSTEEVTTESYESNASNYKYEFKTPSQSEQVTITQNRDYTLGTGDSFTLYEIKDGKIVKTLIFANSTSTRIKITNKLDDNGTIHTTNTKTDIVQTGDITVDKITTIASIESGVENLNYTLNSNESIQIIYPSYYSDSTYSTYVNYRYEGTQTIRANTDHTLVAGEKIILIYTEDGTTKTDIIYPGEVILASFDLVPTDLSSSKGVKKTWTDKLTGTTNIDTAFKTLNSNQTISIRKLMQTKLDNTGIWCYWIVNSDSDGNNKLFQSGSDVKILRSNEYFIYTNSSLNEMIILGAGTKLERTDSNNDQWSIPANTLTINAISDSGVSTDVPWQKNINFAKDPFYITEMNVVTLGETDNIKIIGWSKDLMPRTVSGSSITGYAFNYCGYKDGVQIDDGFSICDGSIIYTINGSSTTLPRVNNFYEIKSRLDLNVGSGIAQQLIYTQEESSEIEDDDVISCQRILINNNKIISPVKIVNNNFGITQASGFFTANYIQTSENIASIGNTVNLIDLVNLYAYSLDGVVYNRTVKLTTSNSSQPKKAEFKFFCSSVSYAGNNFYIVPVHMTGSEVPVTAKFSYIDSGTGIEQDLKIADFNTTVASDTIILSGNNSYYLVPSTTGNTISNIVVILTLEWSDWALSENESLFIDDLCVITGLNSKIKPQTITLSDILSQIKTIIANSDKPSTKPYYPYRLDNSIAMDTTDFDNAYSMWDKNNVANKMTLAQIDLRNSVIDIVNEMRNY